MTVPPGVELGRVAAAGALARDLDLEAVPACHNRAM